MQDKLISYLLGELEADEAAALEQQLDENPQLAAELERLRSCLQPEEENASGTTDGSQPMPLGLADRTADSVSVLASQLDRPADDTPSCRCSFSFLDAAVAIGVVAAVSMMLVPALRESREAHRRRVCTNNLKEIGMALHAYANDHHGYFPVPPPNTNMGAFTISLSGNGYIDREELANRVVCPGSPEASLVSAGELKVSIPSFDELEAAQGEALRKLRRAMALTLAYRLPYRCAQGMHPIEDARESRQPLLSDAPTIVDGQWRSMNHGCGINVLYQDCSVRHHFDFREPVRKDHFFVNAQGQHAPPQSPNDAVLGRSEYVPPTVRIPLRIRTRVLIVPRPSLGSQSDN